MIDDFIDSQSQKRKEETQRLRDEFAGKAMQGILSNPNTNDTLNLKKFGEDCYKLANAMLKARNEKPENI